jgi:uncharacterized membrane protein YdjX (TVP38/TMEM64 family)
MHDILRDLILRLVEVAIVALATEIATFFAYRRFGGDKVRAFLKGRN